MKHWIDTERERLFAEAERRDAEAWERYCDRVSRHNAIPDNPLARKARKDARGPLYRGAMRIVERMNNAAPVIVVLSAAWLFAAIVAAFVGG